MKKILLSTIALLSLSAVASAADLPARRMAPAPFIAAPVFTWTGLYLGAHAGFGWHDSSSVAITDGATFPTGFAFAPNESDGFIGGGQVGYNYQMGNIVVGVEGDISAADISSSATSASPLIAGRTATTSSELNWIASATARAGIAMDKWLFYVKGGWAWADVDSFSETLTGAGALIGNSVGGETRDGFLIGGGVEVALMQNFSVKLEYNYIDLGDETVTRVNTNTAAFGGAVTPLERKVDADVQLVKLGVNYKF